MADRRGLRRGAPCPSLGGVAWQRRLQLPTSGKRNFQKFRTRTFKVSASKLCGVPEVRGSGTVWPAQIVSNPTRPVHPGQAAGSPRHEGHGWAPEPCGLGATEALLLRGEGKAATGRPGYPALMLFRALLLGRMRAVWGWEGAFAQPSPVGAGRCKLEPDPGGPESKALRPSHPAPARKVRAAGQDREPSSQRSNTPDPKAPALIPKPQKPVFRRTLFKDSDAEFSNTPLSQRSGFKNPRQILRVDPGVGRKPKHFA